MRQCPERSQGSCYCLKRFCLNDSLHRIVEIQSRTVLLTRSRSQIVDPASLELSSNINALAISRTPPVDRRLAEKVLKWQKCTEHVTGWIVGGQACCDLTMPRLNGAIGLQRHRNIPYLQSYTCSTPTPSPRKQSMVYPPPTPNTCFLSQPQPQMPMILPCSRR